MSDKTMYLSSCPRPASGCARASFGMRIHFVVSVVIVSIQAFVIRDFSEGKSGAAAFPMGTAFSACMKNNTWYDVHNPASRQIVYYE